jgi:hypothetical protein
VVPASCKGQSITIKWSKPEDPLALSEGIPASVLARTSLDVALLQPAVAPDTSLSYIKLDIDGHTPVLDYKNKCVLLASHYLEQLDTLTSFAEISSVALASDSRRWALAGSGFNPSRSGSPLILANSAAVAVFVARPVGGGDRQIQDRALIVPVRNVPLSEIDLKSLISTAGELHQLGDQVETLVAQSVQVPFGGSVDLLAIVARRPVLSAFGLSLEAQGFRTEPALPTWVERDGVLTRQSSLQNGIVDVMLNGGSVLRQIEVEQNFVADDGFAFDPETLTLEASSHNPMSESLPTHQCTANITENCFFCQITAGVLR